MKFRRFKVGGIAIAVVFLFLYFSSPGKVVVDEQGKVSGLINNARSLVQGPSFWEDQLLEVNSELDWHLKEPQRQAELQRELENMSREFDRSMEEFYREYPDMEPSAAERQAEALRERADQIEQDELDRQLERLRLERIAELRNILPLIIENAE